MLTFFRNIASTARSYRRKYMYISSESVKLNALIFILIFLPNMLLFRSGFGNFLQKTSAVRKPRLPVFDYQEIQTELKEEGKL